VWLKWYSAGHGLHPQYHQQKKRKRKRKTFELNPLANWIDNILIGWPLKKTYSKQYTEKIPAPLFPL
jgi:hypothetical protein